MGLPCVVSRTRTMERYFDPKMVRYCEPGSVESFAAAVLDLYEHPEVRAEMSRNCREFSGYWRWANEKEKYLRVVGGLAGIRDANVPEPRGRVLMLVENLSVPFDRRVWMESLALTEAGYQVAVICPASGEDVLYEVLDGVSIFRYPGRETPREFLLHLGVWLLDGIGISPCQESPQSSRI